MNPIVVPVERAHVMPQVPWRNGARVARSMAGGVEPVQIRVVCRSIQSGAISLCSGLASAIAMSAGDQIGRFRAMIGAAGRRSVF